MTEWLIISAPGCIRTIPMNTVYAVETPDGGWGEVTSIDDMLEQGLHMPAYRIRFASGHVRVATGDVTFRIERNVDLRND